MACVSMCVFPGPCTATGFRVSQQGLIDTDDGFPQWKWVMCFLSGRHTYHRHTRTKGMCLCKVQWVGMAEPSVSAAIWEAFMNVMRWPESLSWRMLSYTYTHSNLLPAHLSAVNYTCNRIIKITFFSDSFRLCLASDYVHISLVELHSDWEACKQYCSSQWILDISFHDFKGQSWWFYIILKNPQQPIHPKVNLPFFFVSQSFIVSSQK